MEKGKRIKLTCKCGKVFKEPSSSPFKTCSACRISLDSRLGGCTRYSNISNKKDRSIIS